MGMFNEIANTNGQKDYYDDGNTYGEYRANDHCIHNLSPVLTELIIHHEGH